MSDGFVGREPDVRLTAKCRQTCEVNREVAVGWYNKDEANSISLQLQPGVVLRWDDDLYLVLVPK